MWMVALMVCTAGGYLLLALSLAITHVLQDYDVAIYMDLVTGGLTRLLGLLGLDRNTVNALAFLLQTVSNFVYAFVALLVITRVSRALRRGPASPAAGQELDAISVGLIVAVLMTAANYVATMD